VRCALGVVTACDPAQVAIITSPNPALEPEESDNYTLGLVFEPTANTSIALDYWSIKRKNEINQEETTAAIEAGSVVRDPSTATTIPGDPGQIIAVLSRYINSATTEVTGIDLDAQQRFQIPEGWGRLTFDLKWTHIFSLSEPNGSTRDFAGTHGNCDVSSCVGARRSGKPRCQLGLRRMACCDDRELSRQH
jgi:iron complex outermembrane receptor protein